MFRGTVRADSQKKFEVLTFFLVSQRVDQNHENAPMITVQDYHHGEARDFEFETVIMVQDYNTWRSSVFLICNS